MTLTTANTQPPRFTGTNPYTATVPEDTGVGHILFTASAVDIDCFDSGSLVYSIVSQTPSAPSGLFGINASTGAVFVTSSLQGHVTGENSTAFSLVLSVRDGGNQNTLTSAIVTIVDVNNFAPVFVGTNNGSE